jgi:hypothetical protein
MTWRVYFPAWQDVYASLLPGEAGQRDCLADFNRRWQGLVDPDDWQVLVPEEPWGLARLQLRLAVFEDEFADEQGALECAGSLPVQSRVVLAGSEQERELQDYGRRQT